MLPCTSILHFGVCVDFVKTILNDLAAFKHSPLFSLSVTTTLIRHCSCASDSAMITVRLRRGN